jgi:hypothetical protein
MTWHMHAGRQGREIPNLNVVAHRAADVHVHMVAQCNVRGENASSTNYCAGAKDDQLGRLNPLMDEHWGLQPYAFAFCGCSSPQSRIAHSHDKTVSVFDN